MNRRSEPPRRVDEPQPGYYRLRLVRKGPFVPAKVECSPSGWRCSIAGMSTGFPLQDPWQVADLSKVCLFGTIITKTEYDAMMKSLHPSPRKRIDLNSEPIVEF